MLYSKSMDREVVITGIGIVSPAGIGKESFWRKILSCESCIDNITSFDTSNLKTKIAADINNFPENNYLSKKDLAKTDKVIPITIASVSEAVEEASINNKELKENISVILGTSRSGIASVEKEHEKYIKNGIKKINPYTICTSMMGMLSYEISQYFGFKGFSHIITSGCTSSLDAIGYAYKEILYGNEDIIITGGSESCITPFIVSSYDKLKALSSNNKNPQKACKPFDLKRDGFVLGAGSYIIIVEEKNHALKRGVTPYANILSYSSNCDTYHRVKNSDDGYGNINAINSAIIKAHLNKEDIDYIALHGTGTKLNDRIETLVMKKCFDNLAYKIPMSSIKSIFGHPIGASGAMALSATLLGMKNNILPPTINLETPDPDCDLDYIPNKYRKGTIKTALINNLGFGSRNSVIIIKA